MDHAPDSIQKRPRLLEWFTNAEWRILAFYFPLALLTFLPVSIVLDYYVPSVSRVLDVVYAIATNVMTFVWCRIDSDKLKIRLGRFFGYAVIIFGPVALIYYLFRSRGPRGGVISLGWLLLYVVVVHIAAMLVALVILLALILLRVLPAAVLN